MMSKQVPYGTAAAIRFALKDPSGAVIGLSSAAVTFALSPSLVEATTLSSDDADVTLVVADASQGEVTVALADTAWSKLVEGDDYVAEFKIVIGSSTYYSDPFVLHMRRTVIE